MEMYKQFKSFMVFHFEKEQEYLQDMHKNGWKFVRISAMGKYCFEKCEADDVVYQIDFNREGAMHMDEYVQMFADCGWEYVTSYNGNCYFRKAKSQMNGEESIFNDGESRMDFIDRVYKGRLFPLGVILSTVIIPQLLTGLLSTHMMPVVIFQSIMLLIYLAIFVYYGYQRKKFREKYLNK